MDFVVISEILGNLAFSLSAAMLIPLVVAISHSEPKAAAAFFFTAVMALLVGGALKQISGASHREDVPVREGVAVTGVGWLMVTLIAMMPYLLGGYLGPLDSLAEAVSGLSGTGATFIADLDPLPRSLLFWRSLTNWIGGIGVIVIFMALLPQFGRGTMNLLKAESTGPVAERQLPRIRDNAIALFSVYIFFTLSCAVVYFLCGLDWYTAINYALTTIATGGFSTYNDSFIHFNSPLLESCAIFFMLLSSGSFGMYVLAAANGKDGWRIIAKNTEYKVFLLIFVIATALITIDLSSEMGWSVMESLRFAAFQAASLGSTTGFVSADFDLWPSFSKGVLLMLMFLGGCAGSTSGGFKITRFIVLLKMVKNLISQKLHPQSINRITVNGVQFPEQVLFNIARHFFVYVMLDILFAFFLIFDGISMIDAVSISISTMSSVGPGFGIAGATSTYALLPTFSEAVACFAMFLGRLEIFTVLALLTPEFWRKGKRW